MSDEVIAGIMLIPIVILLIAFGFVIWLVSGEVVLWALDALSMEIDECLFRTLWWSIGYVLMLTRAVGANKTKD